MERSSRSRGRISNKEIVPPAPSGVEVKSQKQIKSKKRTHSSVLANLAPKSKKVKGDRAGKDLPPPEPPTFSGLPYDVLDHLLQYLDVASLMALGRTSSQFDLLINGRFLTSAKLPFNRKGAFMKEIRESQVIEKKPVLRILCRKPRTWQQFLEGKPQLETHLDLLSLNKVREVHLLPKPGQIQQMDIWPESFEYDQIILDRLSSVGALSHISFLSIGFENKAESEYVEKIMPALTNLIELVLFVNVSER